MACHREAQMFQAYEERARQDVTHRPTWSSQMIAAN